MLNGASPRSAAMIAEMSLANPAFRRHCAKAKYLGIKNASITHPYDILNVVRLISTLMGNVYGEKYIIELYTSEILGEYIRRMRDNALHENFMFAKEAIDYFQNAHALVPSLSRVTDTRERVELVNNMGNPPALPG